MKFALVFTSTTKELNRTLAEELERQLPGIEYDIHMDPDILVQIREAGYVTPKAAAKLLSLYVQAIHDGANAILNVCSSVGDIARAARQLGEAIGVPVIPIDESMACKAVERGRRIGVVATLQSTLVPTKNGLLRAAESFGKEVKLIDCLVDGAFGADPEQFRQALLLHAEKIADRVDVIVLAQASMAYSESFLTEKIGKPVFSSIRTGIENLSDVLRKQLPLQEDNICH